MDTGIGSGSHGHRDMGRFTWTQGYRVGSHGHRDRIRFTGTQG